MTTSVWHRNLGVGSQLVDGDTIFEVNSSSKGSRPAPKMNTVERDAIATPDDGLLIFNTDDSQYQYYSVPDAEWKPVGSGGVGYQELLGVGNGSQTQFVLTLIPSDGNSVLVWIDGSLAELTTDYSWNIGTNEIIFVSAPAIAQKIYVFYLTEGNAITVPTPSGTEYLEYLTLTPTDITNKYVSLASTPAAPSKTMVDWVAQTAQIFGVDFTVTGTQLSWNGLALDGVILSGEILRVHYYN